MRVHYLLKTLISPSKAMMSFHEWAIKWVLDKQVWFRRSITHQKTTRNVWRTQWQCLWIRASTSPWTQRWIPPPTGRSRLESGQILTWPRLKCCWPVEEWTALTKERSVRKKSARRKQAVWLPLCDCIDSTWMLCRSISKWLFCQDDPQRFIRKRI